MRKRGAAILVLLALGCASSVPDVSTPAPPPETQLAELQTSMTELLERLDVLSDRISRLEQAREDSAAGLDSPPPVSVRSAPAPTAQAPAAAAPASGALRSARLAEQYRSAIMLFGTNRVAEARAAFQQVFDADPASELADNALFWIGETYFRSGDYANAISYYRRVSSDYGDQNKAPDAVYKLALAYVKTGDLVLARQTLQEVITRYPYSTQSASARAELERIKY